MPQILLYAYPHEVEKDAIKQLINIAESGLAVKHETSPNTKVS